MRQLLCSSGVALLLMSGSATLAYGVTATETIRAPAVQTVPATDPAAHGVSAPVPSLAPQPAAEPSAKVKDDKTQIAPLADDPALLKLKAQIKTVRLSLAEATGRLIVTEKNLTGTSSDLERMRGENVSLRTGLTKAETISKMAQEELAVRRAEMRALEQRPTGSGSSTGLLLSLAVSLILAAAVFGQGKRLHRMVARLPDGRAEEKRREELRAQLVEEQQRAQRLEEEAKRLREVGSRPTVSMTAAGGKSGKVEIIRRELRDVRSAAEEQKRTADARIESLEAEVQRLANEKLSLDEALAKANEKLVFLGHDEPEEKTAPTID
jgi:hypothetical protein